MQSALFRDTTTFMVKPVAVPTEIACDDDEVSDLAGIRALILGIEIYYAFSGLGETTPILSIETSDDYTRDSWVEVWASSGSSTSTSKVVTLSADLDRGQPYRLARYLRWKVTFPGGSIAGPSTITFRITGTAA